MNLKKLIPACILGLSCGTLSAQSDSTHLMKWRPTSVQILRGFQVGNYNPLDASYFSKLNDQVDNYLPNPGDKLDNSYNSYYNSSKNIGFYTELMRLMPDKQSYRKNQSLRIGVLYQERSFGSIAGKEHIESQFDTLTSDVDGKKVYYKYTETEAHTISHDVGELKIDAAYIFKTGDQYQLNLFGGIGMNLGASVYSKARIERRTTGKDSYSSSPIDLDDNGYRSNYAQETQYLNSKNFISVGFYVPFGLDYRLSMNSEAFSSKLHTGFEARPYLEFAKAKTFTSIHYNLVLKLDL